MVGIALVMCAYVATDLFSPPHQSEWTFPAQQDQFRVSIPSPTVTFPPLKSEARTASAPVPTGNAGRQMQPIGGGDTGSRVAPQSYWGGAPVDVPAPIPRRTANRQSSPFGMENEDNPLPQPRPIK